MQQINSYFSSLAQKTNYSAEVTGIRGSASAFVAANLIKIQSSPALCIVPSESHAHALIQDLTLLSDLRVFHYPAHEIPPYTPLSPDQKTVSNRIATLYRVITTKPPYIVVASAESLLRKILPADNISCMAELVMSNEETDPEELKLYLSGAGYEQMSLVQNAGEFSVRGGIFDVFPSGSDYPVRLDFFGDLIESIRYFDPVTQRSVREIEEVEFIPASDIIFPNTDEKREQFLARVRSFSSSSDWDKDEEEVLTEKILNSLNFPGIEFFLPLLCDELVSPLTYFSEESKIFIFEPLEIKKSINLTLERVHANYQESCEVQTIALPPKHLFLDEDSFYQQLNKSSHITFKEFQEISMSPIETLSDDEGRVTVEQSSQNNNNLITPASNILIKSSNHKLIKQNIELKRRKEGILGPLSNYLEKWLGQGDTVHLACRSSRHAVNIAELLENHNLPVKLCGSTIRHNQSVTPSVFIYDIPLSEGFDLPGERLHFVSETELFGEKRVFPQKKHLRTSSNAPVNFEELGLGDIVVHSDHGIGIYNGIINLEHNSISNDFLQITYRDEDKLYIPVDRINSVSKYSGLSDKKPAITRLGSQAWITTKKKVKEAVWEVAQNLLNLYARRKLEKGHIFSQPDSMYQELEESFPYNETPGQLKAISEVIEDLTSERCMDRLICGDVGFGKTEVAIRAAFKVATDSKQIAVLVPTTVLAEQHTQTFRERLDGFPINIECLNRFRSTAEQKSIIRKIKDGTVDIVIGTHRILSKDVQFSNIGLIIIDEEHRFGVSHKEKLKILRAKVDVLTLTATPIPRTLQMSLLGVRDLSIIDSPPRHRLSVKTFISKYDELVIKEAVVRELQRGGQVFLVHNRVNSIHEIANKVQQLVPEARVAVAHGQMPGKALEDIMVSFVQKKINVLICTTIIESGLDIPNANTIIINRADRLGLAGIYQLRGRVGRSSEQAFAYLLVPSLEHLSKDAKQRLRAIMEYNELGGGFKLALSDLQIRGGGNILGESQSGNIAAVGYDLYLDLLQRTVDDLKRKVERGENLNEDDYLEPEIKLNISAYISSSYISDSSQRYIAYKRITSLSSSTELMDIRDEFIDRYGKLPPYVENLFTIISIKGLLKKYKVTKLEQSPDALVYSFHPVTPISTSQILKFINLSKDSIRMTPDSRLVVKHDTINPKTIFSVVKNTLHAITQVR